MMFLTLKNGNNINLTHISNIKVDNTDIVFESAKGSLNGYIEHYETKQEADARFQELQNILIVE